MPLETRICRICDDHLLGDEFHFLLFCEGLKPEHTAVFQDLRQNRDTYPTRSQEEMVRTLLSKEAIKTTSKHLELMYNRRKELLYQHDEEETVEGQMC